MIDDDVADLVKAWLRDHDRVVAADFKKANGSQPFDYMGSLYGRLSSYTGSLIGVFQERGEKPAPLDKLLRIQSAYFNPIVEEKGKQSPVGKRPDKRAIVAAYNAARKAVERLYESLPSRKPEMSPGSANHFVLFPNGTGGMSIEFVEFMKAMVASKGEGSQADRARKVAGDRAQSMLAQHRRRRAAGEVADGFI